MKPIFFSWVIAIILLISSTWLGISKAQDGSQGKWTATGNLHTARVCHTATLLPDGRTLVVGGSGVSGELASVELYDPKQGVFTPAADMSAGRAYHSATLLPNGQVLVVGGQLHDNTLSSAELYNPATNTWTNTGSLHVARSFHTATLLPSGLVLVVGGARMAAPPVFAQGAPPGSALDVAELYDPASGKWTITDNLNVARYVHTATLLKNGRVLVTGGIGAKGFDDDLSSAEVYDPNTKSFSMTGSLLKMRYHHSATFLPSGEVLVVGGQFHNDILDSVELYNPLKGVWTPTTSLSTPTDAQKAILMPSGEVWIIGGGDNPKVLANVRSYNPVTKTWQELVAMNNARSLHTATLMPDGRILVTGGLYENGSPTNVQSSAELYDPTAKPTQASNPKPASGENVQPPVQSYPTISSLFTLTMCLVIFTGCLVLLTACVVILLCAWLVYALIRRWGK